MPVSLGRLQDFSRSFRESITLRAGQSTAETNAEQTFAFPFDLQVLC
ncbi:MAG TPA: hypothetical protein VGL71_02270 [Urbifossiella sp.]